MIQRLANRLGTQCLRWILIPMLLVTGALFFTCSCSRRSSRSEQSLSLQGVVSNDSLSALINPKLKSVLIFTKTSSFNCPPCFDSYQELVMTLLDMDKTGKLRRNLLILATAENQTDDSDTHVLDGLKKSRGWKISSVFVPIDFFEQNHIQKSSVALVAEGGVIELLRQFPLMPEQLQEIVRLLNKDR
jgi:hypothetical protein